GGRDQGEAPDRKEEEHDERDGQSRVADVAAERHVVRTARLEEEHDHEDDRDDRGSTETEVRALLGQQFRELPTVDPGHGGHEATAARSWSLDSPPVRPRNNSSRLARSGVSAVMPMRACPSAIESAATDSSSALKRTTPSSTATLSTPVCVRQTVRARSGSPARIT